MLLAKADVVCVVQTVDSYFAQVTIHFGFTSEKDMTAPVTAKIELDASNRESLVPGSRFNVVLEPIK